MRMKDLLRVLALLLAPLFLGSKAYPHEVRPAYLQIDETRPDQFDVLWKQPRMGALMLRLKPELSNGLLDVPPSEEYIDENFIIRRWEQRPFTRGTFDGATVRVEGLERTLTDALIVVGFADGQRIATVLKPSKPEFVLDLAGNSKLPAGAYLTLGIEHILTGFDHLSFVLCLMLLIRGPEKLLKTLTAFTVAHSITLSATALGYVRINAPLVESLIALSIIFLAVELTRFWRGHPVLTSRHPWMIAFIFGLLHGFGFAGSLAEIGLPSQNIPGALLLFNCGVEIGQFVFVGVVIAVIMVTRSRWPVAVRSACWLLPYAVGTLASLWMFERIVIAYPLIGLMRG